MSALTIPESGICTPGHDNIPGSLLGELICGTWLPDMPSDWTQLADQWPYAAAAFAAAIVSIGLWRYLQQAVWKRTVRDGAWLEIIPPVAATPAATAQLWLLLAGQLKAPGRFTLSPKRLVFEVHATANRMRLGVLVPAGLNPSAVRRTIEKAWRGARVSQTCAPRLPSAMPARAQVLGLRQPDWLPFTEEPSSRHDGPDNLHPVFEGLAAAGRGGAGLLQVIVARAPARRVKVFWQAGRDPVKAARRNTGAMRSLDLATRGLRTFMLGTLNLIQSTVTSTSTGSSPRSPQQRSPLADPFQAERAKLARIKGSRGAHLLIGVRMFAAATETGAANANVNDISGGYAAVSAMFTRRRQWRAHKAAVTRWMPAQAMFLATVTETAAVAGIPADPPAYGLPAASSRRRPGSNDTFRASGGDLESLRPPRQSDDDGDVLDPWELA